MGWIGGLTFSKITRVSQSFLKWIVTSVWTQEDKVYSTLCWKSHRAFPWEKWKLFSNQQASSYMMLSSSKCLLLNYMFNSYAARATADSFTVWEDTKPSSGSSLREKMTSALKNISWDDFIVSEEKFLEKTIPKWTSNVWEGPEKSSDNILINS